MSLLPTVRKFIETKHLFSRSDKLLLAVSGGRDSVVMAHALNELGYNVGIAHINYCLRGEDSKQDMIFVKSLADQLSISCHTYVVSPDEIVALSNNNLQEEARKIRYRFFDKIMESDNYGVVCTAHHRQDNAESFLLNALRGSGLRGLRSIQAMNDNIRRPLLDCSTDEIVAYANEQNVRWREDQSNLSTAYNRNYLRHEIFPILEKRWLNSINSIHQSAVNAADTYALLEGLIGIETPKWKEVEGSQISIGPISELIEVSGAKTLLYYLTKDLLISDDQLERILQGHLLSGLDFSNTTYKIYIHGDYLIAEKKKEMNNHEIIIDSIGKYEYPNIGSLTIEDSEVPNIDIRKNVEFIDRDCINFPLTMRVWQDGDKLAPLGLQGRKKLVSDILTDRKINRIQKEKELVLEDSNGVIIWLIGHRLSHHVRLKQGSKKILQLKFLKLENEN